MRAPASLLHPAASAPVETPSSPAPVMSVDSDMVVILASLLCALVCVLGLALVSRCACRRHRRRRSSSSGSADPPPKGLKKKAIDALPTLSFPSSSATTSATSSSSSSECAICLAEFAEGELLRVLPGCGHGFHAPCVDAWLRTCATCPSCRAAISSSGATAAMAAPAAAAAAVVVVVVAAAPAAEEGGGSRCGRCGELAAAAPASGHGGGDDAFLP
ncbi:probable E3 ubiquitin-protein ligase ATL44 [Brachypodium distachyon]|uniref:RING-type E3 ubiquitin transferase n=1 Tax=Brachypodium distachyon TaxID=15368 RepID=A0A2K2DLZ8_BRADI|nr:probable E3 ubiquitin-protein ligase ATL44 [Brachypodium distachyon]PNT75296.1 hypothetical protein BRADI_1g29611v3 [Brachypodium distachyon]|eukprot:XP_010229697.1 probable E3 ubiquitin-protein ligase ATL44 [Brachypodium distachyon]